MPGSLAAVLQIPLVQKDTRAGHLHRAKVKTIVFADTDGLDEALGEGLRLLDAVDNELGVAEPEPLDG